MNKIILLFFFSFVMGKAWSQPGQIVDGGFENWHLSQVYEYPDFWYSSNTLDFKGTQLTIKSYDAQSLLYSARLENEFIEGTKMFGYISWGVPCLTTHSNNGDIYSNTFDQVNGYFKCNMAGMDTAYIICYKSYNLVAYPLVYAKFTGSVSTWTPFSIPVPAVPTDSIGIVVCSSNPFHHANFHPASWFMVDNITLANSMGPAPAQLPNQDFESWTLRNMIFPTDWNTINERVPNPDITVSFVNANSDAHSGSWSASISSRNIDYALTDSCRGMITNGTINMMNPLNPFVPFTYNYSPAWFTGYYKYDNGTGTDSTAAIIDTAVVEVKFFAGGVTVGGFTKLINSVASSWTLISEPLNITTTPDSLVVSAMSGIRGNSVLKIDDFYFFGGTLDAENLSEPQNGFLVYPNPAINKLIIESDHTVNEPVHYQLTDIMGKLVQSGSLFYNSNQQQEIYIENLTSGMYTYRLSGDAIQISGKFLKQ